MMEATLQSPAIKVSSTLLSEIERAYDQSRILDAWEIAKSIGPLTAWAGPEAAIWAGRLAMNLGGSRLAGVIHWKNWRKHPHHPSSLAFYYQTFLDRRGPLKTWEALRQVPEPPPETSPDVKIHLLTLRSDVAADFRDFEAAWQYLNQAREIDPKNRWLLVSEAALLERQDRYDEALDRARLSLETNPFYRPGIQRLAHLFQVTSQKDQALRLLRNAVNQTQSAPLLAQLAILEQDSEQFEESLRHYDEWVISSPLADKHSLKWLNLNRIAVACRLGDLGRARHLAEQINEPYYRELTARLSAPQPIRRRVQCAVPFVRQHHMTCAPATLTALCHFWNRPARHIEVVEKICYDGTPAHSEREWLEDNGFCTREFTLTWEDAVALLDRGVPFTLTTTEVTSGHLQAVIGYDTLRQSLLLRDPYVYLVSEALCPQFLDRYRSTGPRGLAAVPISEKARLEDLALTDSDLYDQLHALNRALSRHDRESAVIILSQLQLKHPQHRLTLQASRALGHYDGNSEAILQSIENLLLQFPNDPHLSLVKWSCLTENGSRDSRLDFLEKVVQSPKCDPVFFIRLAQELKEDGRQRDQAKAWLMWGLRYRPTDPDFLKSWADFLWDVREFDRALEFYRFAALGADKKEQFSHSFFLAARFVSKTDEAIEFLQKRVEKLGRQSAYPVFTLYDALVQLDRTEEAFAVLEEAGRLRPEDGELLLFSADSLARFGHLEQARDFLARAETKTRNTNWLRSAATIADYRCDRKEALRLYKKVLEVEPCSMDAIRAIAFLTDEIFGKDEAALFLDGLLNRFPANCSLLSFQAEFLRDSFPQKATSALRRLIELNPASAWAHRELALYLERSDRLEEAFQMAEQAISIEPNSPFGFCVRAELRFKSGQRELAMADCRQALLFSIDCSFALEKWVEACQTDAARQEVLAFAEKELVRQVVFGDALRAFHNVARGILSPEATLFRLEDAWKHRPDCWSTWSVYIQQLTEMDRLDEALAFARNANERFPLLPRLWFDRARIHQLKNEYEEAIDALNHALAINPGYSHAARFQAELYELSSQLEKARQVMERACAQQPMEPANHGGLAELLWKLDRKSEAIEQVTHALRLNPEYEWGWRTLRLWGADAGSQDLALPMAQDLVERRPGDPQSWLRLAECLFEAKKPEAIQAADKAIHLNPRNPTAWDVKARLLVFENRFDEALACCHPKAIPDRPPELSLREAWTEAQRGRMSHAIELLEKALASHARQHYSGWQLLADWCVQENNFQRAREAADQLAVLSPQDPIPLGYAADICRKQSDREGAIKRLARAFELDPNYQYAGLTLLDFYLEDKKFKESRQILQKLLLHNPNAFVKTRAIRLELAEGNEKIALEEFEQLCQSTDDDAWPLFAAADSFTTRSQVQKSNGIIERSLQASPRHPWLGSVYILRRLQRDLYSMNGTLRRLFLDPVLGVNAMMTYIDGLVDIGLKNRGVDSHVGIKYQLKKLLRRKRELLSSDDTLWGKMGYGLVSFGYYRKAEDWLKNWQTRKAVEPWMLYNYLLALNWNGRFEQLLPIIRVALNQRQDSNLFINFASWGAFEEALSGDPATASHLLSLVKGSKLPTNEKALTTFAQLMLDNLNHLTPWKRWKWIAGEIRRALDRQPTKDFHSIVRISTHRCLQQLIRKYRQPSLRLFEVWNFYGKAWLLLPLLLVIGISTGAALNPIVGIGLAGGPAVIYAWLNRRH